MTTLEYEAMKIQRAWWTKKRAVNERWPQELVAAANRLITYPESEASANNLYKTVIPLLRQQKAYSTIPLSFVSRLFYFPNGSNLENAECAAILFARARNSSWEHLTVNVFTQENRIGVTACRINEEPTCVFVQEQVPDEHGGNKLQIVRYVIASSGSGFLPFRGPRFS